MNVMSDREIENKIDNESSNDSCDQSRRDAMKKMGKYAVYTAPAMMTLLASKKSMAGCSMCG
jgi:hypothetical protein